MRSAFDRGSPFGGRTWVSRWPGTTMVLSSVLVRVGREGGGAATCEAATAGAALGAGAGVGATDAVRAGGGAARGAGAGAAACVCGGGNVACGAGAGATTRAGAGAGAGDRWAFRPAGSMPAQPANAIKAANTAVRPNMRRSSSTFVTTLARKLAAPSAAKLRPRTKGGAMLIRVDPRSGFSRVRISRSVSPSRCCTSPRSIVVMKLRSRPTRRRFDRARSATNLS